MDPATASSLQKEIPKKHLIPMPPISSKRIKLESFTAPRDLTLGGSGFSSSNSKFVAAPNLNVKRRKDLSVGSLQKTTQDAHVKSHQKESNFNRAKRTNKLAPIQTLGIFSEGMGPPVAKKSSNISKRRETVQSGIRKPAVKKNDIKKESNQPKGDIEQILLEEYNEASLKIDDTNKYETVHITKPMVQRKSLTKYPFTYPGSLEEFFDKKEPQLLLMQVPEAFTAEEEANSENTESLSDSDDPFQFDVKQPNILNVGNKEGQVGKLVRYKSGKVEWVLGKIPLKVEMGVTTGFSQHLVSICEQKEDLTADLYNLGQISGKLIARPDWQNLITNSKKFETAPRPISTPIVNSNTIIDISEGDEGNTELISQT